MAWKSFYQSHIEAFGLLFALIKICLAAAIITMFSLNFSDALDDYHTVQDASDETKFSANCAIVLEDSAAERGLSSSYVTGNRTDDEFFDLLSEQRERLDNSLDAAVPQLQEGANEPDEKATAKTLTEWAKSVPDFRDRVNDPADDLTVGEILRYYTTMNDILIGSAATFSTFSAGRVMTAAAAWGNILSLYDNLGRQRALATSATVVGTSWGGVSQLDFIQRTGNINGDEFHFIVAATSRTKKAYENWVESSLNREVVDVRDYLQESDVPSGTGISAVDTWDLYTRNLAVLYEVRNLALDDLEDALDDAEDETTDRLITNSIGLAIGAIACIAILAEAVFSFVSLYKRQQKMKELEGKFGNEQAGGWS